MTKIFGINIANLSPSETLIRLDELRCSGSKHLVVTANPEILLAAHNNPEYRKAIASASLVLPDGVGVVVASYFLGQPISCGRVTGVDLVEALVKNSGNQGYSVFLAGSTEAVLNKTTQYFALKYKNIRIAGALGSEKAGPYSKEEYKIFSDNLLRKIKQAKPDVLLLALGHPKQELWLSEHLTELPVKIVIGVGGSFDYISGQIRRAPKWLRKTGLEWLFRLLNEPWRFFRIINATVLFPFFVLIDIIKKMFHVEQKKK